MGELLVEKIVKSSKYKINWVIKFLHLRKRAMAMLTSACAYFIWTSSISKYWVYRTKKELLYWKHLMFPFVMNVRHPPYMTIDIVLYCPVRFLTILLTKRMTWLIFNRKL